MFCSHSCPNHGGLELAHIVVPAVLQMYKLYTPDGSDELALASQALLSTSEANFSLALENLAVGNLTHRRLGLRWWLACPPFRERASSLTSADIYLNAYGIWLVESLQGILKETKREVWALMLILLLDACSIHYNSI